MDNWPYFLKKYYVCDWLSSLFCLLNDNEITDNLWQQNIYILGLFGVTSSQNVYWT